MVILSACGPVDALAAAPSAPVRPQRPPEPPVPSEPLSLVGAATTGAKSATAALVMYSDYQCPFCGRFERENLPEIRKKYVDKGVLLLAFREFPLSIHQHAEKAAEAAECAGQQGKFWDMHDQLFAHQQQLDDSDLRQYAHALGLAPGFDTCLAGTTATKVANDESSGRSIQVSGTPTFFLGQLQTDGRVKVTNRWTGAQPLDQVEALIDKATSTEPQRQK